MHRLYCYETSFKLFLSHCYKSLFSQIMMVNTIKNVSISLNKDIDLTDSMIILGLPTIGLIGSIACNYIADSLNLKSVGSIRSKYFLPGTIIKDSIPVPPIRMHYAENGHFDTNGICSSILTVVSDFPLPQSAVYPLMDELLTLAHKRNISMFLGLEGIKSEDKNEDHVDVYGVGSTERMNNLLQQHGIEDIKDVLIKGLNGAMLSEQTENNQDMLCIFTEGHIRYPDSRAAGRLLEKIDAMLPGIHLDLDPLYKEAEKIEDKIKQYIKQSRKIPESKTMTITDMYQ